MADDTERRKAAVDRLKNRRAFGQDLVAFVVVNAGLVFVWAVTGGGYFWPAWIIGFWGIGLVMHGWSAFMQRPITEEEIEREMRRGGDAVG